MYKVWKGFIFFCHLSHSATQECTALLSYFLKDKGYLQFGDFVTFMNCVDSLCDVHEVKQIFDSYRVKNLGMHSTKGEKREF